MIEELIIFGAISGSMYALLALGFTLTYGVCKIENLTHGAIFMLGAYFFFAFGPLGFLNLSMIAALILATIVVSIVGVFAYKLAMSRVVENEVALLTITIALSLVYERIILLTFGRIDKSVPSLTSGYIVIWGMRITHSRLLASVVSLIICVGLLLFIRKSKIGRAMRSLAQDRETAMLMGINSERISMLTIAISAALAAVAGILITSSTIGMASPFMWQIPLTTSFAIVILGGLGSVEGTLIGAYIVAYAETAFTLFVPGGTYLRTAVGLSIMVLVLLFRPKGLLGKRVRFE